MNKIIALLFAVGIITASETSPQILKRVVTGGITNATIGQVVAGASNGFNVGIRTPNKVVASTKELEVIDYSISVYPNPTDGIVFFSGDNIKSVNISDLYGKSFNYTINMTTNGITLPHRGVFFIKITNTNNQVYSTSIVFN
jgi:hypothetical protein